MYSQNDKNHVERESGLPTGYKIDDGRYQHQNRSQRLGDQYPSARLWQVPWSSVSTQSVLPLQYFTHDIVPCLSFPNDTVHRKHALY